MQKGLSIREFARRDGCNEKLVRRKLTSGHLTAFEDGSIDPKLVGSDWRKRVRTPGADTGLDAADSADVSAPDVRSGVDDFETLAEVAERIIRGDPSRKFPKKADAELQKETYAALLMELKYDREVGAVAEIDEFVEAVAAEYALVKNRLFNIGSRLAPRCAVMNSAEEIKALIDREVTLALEELTLDAGGRGIAGGPAEPV